MERAKLKRSKTMMQNYERLYERCREQNNVLNQDRKVVVQTEINFHGHLFTSEGMKADKNKVEAILEMPAPTDISGVRRLCGMVQYLSRFLPNLSGDLEPIRELTRKDHEWNWSSECDEALTLLKTKMAETAVLAYYNQDKQNVLQDSSQHGIGAVLMQEGKPVEYASRSLFPSEGNWAQIEKELLLLYMGSKDLINTHTAPK